MKEMDGFVYDPRFFMYGEDVDLFIRARQHGFRTKPLHADIRRNEVIWHLGSGSTDPKVVRSVDKSPDMAGHVLSGCVRNLWLHAGTFEFIPLLLLHIWFRIAFCALYWRTHSWREVRFLALAGLPPGVRRSSRKRTAAFFLSGLVALMYRRPVVWARRWRTGSQSAIKKLEQNRAKRATTVID
jgi:hypothetical protein